jgi:hypothetical protein
MEMPSSRPAYIFKLPDLEAEFEIRGNGPAQAFGSVIERNLWFRKYHDRWSFDIADRDGNFPSDHRAGPDGFFREGRRHDAGWMTTDEVAQLIVSLLNLYFNDVLSRVDTQHRKPKDEKSYLLVRKRDSQIEWIRYRRFNDGTAWAGSNTEHRGWNNASDAWRHGWESLLFRGFLPVADAIRVGIVAADWEPPAN